MSKLAVFTIVVRVEDHFNPHSAIYGIETKDAYLEEIETAQVSAVLKADDDKGVVAEWF